MKGLVLLSSTFLAIASTGSGALYLGTDLPAGFAITATGSSFFSISQQTNGFNALINVGGGFFNIVDASYQGDFSQTRSFTYSDPVTLDVKNFQVTLNFHIDARFATSSAALTNSTSGSLPLTYTTGSSPFTIFDVDLSGTYSITGPTESASGPMVSIPLDAPTSMLTGFIDPSLAPSSMLWRNSSLIPSNLAPNNTLFSVEVDGVNISQQLQTFSLSGRSPLVPPYSLNAVPEPSSSIGVVAAAIGLASRRKRAHR